MTIDKVFFNDSPSSPKGLFSHGLSVAEANQSDRKVIFILLHKNSLLFFCYKLSNRFCKCTKTILLKNMLYFFQRILSNSYKQSPICLRIRQQASCLLFINAIGNKNFLTIT